MKFAEQMKEYFKTPFFKESSMKETSEGVIFSDGEFFVEIKENIVSIERIKEKKFILPPECDSFLRNIHELSEYQAHTIEGIVYKDFKKMYVNSVLNKRPNLFDIKKIADEKIELLITEAQIHMEEHFKKMEIWKKEQFELNNIYKENSKFLLSINNDLLVLQKNGFEIKSSMWTKFHSDLLEVIGSVYSQH